MSNKDTGNKLVVFSNILLIDTFIEGDVYIVTALGFATFEVRAILSGFVFYRGLHLINPFMRL